MKLRVCFKDHYPCRAETCGEYDVCKVRLAKEEQTNEEWFCQLPTEEKAEFLDNIIPYSDLYDQYDRTDWEKWLKEEHKE